MMLSKRIFSSKLQRVEEDEHGKASYRMKVRDDSFIHFTLQERIPEILESGKILMNPPYQKFGGDAVYAVSLTFGQKVPGVQATHIDKDEGRLGAIWFKTNTVPKVGFVEEVSWNRDVNLTSAHAVSVSSAWALIGRATEEIDEMEYVLYS